MGLFVPKFVYFKYKEIEMVSLAEKMAANLDMSVFGKAEELKKRLWFTILALIVFLSCFEGTFKVSFNYKDIF